MAQFFHPGVYTGDNPCGYKWYLPFYKKHEHLVGLEVFHRADEHPQDREMWDKLFFACNKTSKNAPQPPQITSIEVTGRNEKITIEAENYDEIIWISEGEKVGSLIFLFAAQAKILILLAVCIGALIGCFLED